ncbi:MAG: hypothetical protein IJD10_07615 [Clostridia bacterium]|nr:hypothetical protein [Clostridia bacterium]
MKYVKPLLLSFGYALFGGLSLICFLRILSIGASAFAGVSQYPRLIPFCIAVGILSLLACLGLLILNVMMFGKEPMEIPMWDRILLEVAVTVLLIIPSAIGWDKVLRWLSETF